MILNLQMSQHLEINAYYFLVDEIFSESQRCIVVFYVTFEDKVCPLISFTCSFQSDDRKYLQSISFLFRYRSKQHALFSKLAPGLETVGDIPNQRATSIFIYTHFNRSYALNNHQFSRYIGCSKHKLTEKLVRGT